MVTIVTLAFWAGSASAQNGRANTNSTFAVLRIQVVVAPVLHSPVAPVENRAEAVSYMVPAVRTQQDAMVEVTPLRNLKERFACVGSCDGTLKTTTVVAK
jgi:hypothetical protein